MVIRDQPSTANDVVRHEEMKYCAAIRAPYVEEGARFNPGLPHGQILKMHLQRIHIHLYGHYFSDFEIFYYPLYIYKTY